MKKLLAICAAAALALGIAGCANEDATLTIGEAQKSATSTAAAAQAATTAFTLDAEELEIHEGEELKLTPSNTAYTIVAESEDTAVATVKVNADNTVTVTGVAEGETTVSVGLIIPAFDAEEPLQVAEAAITVIKGIAVSFAGLTNATPSLKATITSITDDANEFIKSATDLAFTPGDHIATSVDDTFAEWGTPVGAYREGSGKNLPFDTYWVKGSNLGSTDPAVKTYKYEEASSLTEFAANTDYYVKDEETGLFSLTTDASVTANTTYYTKSAPAAANGDVTIAAFQQLGTFSTTITAAKAVKVEKIAFAGGINWGDHKLKIELLKGSTVAYTTYYGSEEQAATYLDSNNKGPETTSNGWAKGVKGSITIPAASAVSLAADDTLTIKVTALNKQAKGKSSNYFNFGIGQLTVDFEEVTAE